MNFKKWVEVNYLTWSVNDVISSFNSIILAFTDIRMV
jgi:hypothetical protein